MWARKSSVYYEVMAEFGSKTSLLLMDITKNGVLGTLEHPENTHLPSETYGWLPL